MAVGDVINETMPSSTTFQPAAGVEIIVLSVFGGSDSVWQWGFTDGTNFARKYQDYIGDRDYTITSMGIKFGITNTMYYSCDSTDTSSRGFSGIQIK